MVGCNLTDFLRRPATRDPIKDWSLTNQKESLIKIIAALGCYGY
jgi:hypothetical protein